MSFDLNLAKRQDQSVTHLSGSLLSKNLKSWCWGDLAMGYGTHHTAELQDTVINPYDR